MRNAVMGKNVVISRGERVALRDSDFVIPQGSITAIIGPNGAGKSTLLHAIAGLLPISNGTLSVLGSTPQRSQSQIAYVLQYTSISKGTPLTVREAVGMGRYPSLGPFSRPRSQDKRRIEQAMERLDITHLADPRRGEDLTALWGPAAAGLCCPGDYPRSLDVVAGRTFDGLGYQLRGDHRLDHPRGTRTWMLGRFDDP